MTFGLVLRSWADISPTQVAATSPTKVKTNALIRQRPG
jgi:hypothetical protein